MKHFNANSEVERKGRKGGLVVASDEKEDGRENLNNE